MQRAQNKTITLGSTSILEILPIEILFLIISNLTENKKDLLSVLLTCKSFASIVTSDPIQKRIKNKPKNYRANVSSVKLSNTFGMMRFKKTSFSPDDKQIVASGIKSINIHSTISSEQIKTIPFPHEPWMADIEFTPDGNKILAKGFHHLYVLDAENGDLLHKCEHKHITMPLVVSSKGKYAITVSPDQAVCWNIDSYTIVNSFDDTSIIHADISPNDKLIVTVSTLIDFEQTDDYHFSIKIRNIETGKLLHEIKKSSAMQTCNICFSADSQLIAISIENQTFIHDVKTGEMKSCLREENTSKNNANSVVEFSPSGSHLICGNSKYGITIWDLATKKPHHISVSKSNTILSIHFHPASNIFLALSNDGVLAIINLDTYKLVYKRNLPTVDNENNPTPQATFSRHGNIAIKTIHGLSILAFPEQSLTISLFVKKKASYHLQYQDDLNGKAKQKCIVQ